MYKIKEKPEDFVVKEISTVKFKEQGKYSYFWLKKTNYTTLRAIEAISNQLRIPLKKFGFAGNKDRKAITEQMCSVENVSESRLNGIKLTDIEISFKGKGDEPICLGDLEGNEFEIVVRNVEKKPEIKKTFINYFGEQRFSTNNAKIGKSIVKKDFKTAVELILEGKGQVEERVKAHLQENPNNYVGALKCVPKKILSLYVHAYQSLLWNIQAECSKENSIPIVGFATEIDKKIMEEEKINTRDFVIKQIPQLSSEGGSRDRVVEAKDVSISNLEIDEWNDGKQKVLIKFKLSKGSYATEYIKQLICVS
jgi:tRNA pseudouridine13 synthase